jgi:hypothetical protein
MLRLYNNCKQRTIISQLCLQREPPNRESKVYLTGCNRVTLSLKAPTPVSPKDRTRTM